MLSPTAGNSSDDFLTTRRRQLFLRRRRLKLLTATPHHKTTTGVEPNASDTPSKGGSSSSAKSKKTEPSPSSSTTPFRRLDGDVKRHPGIPLSGEEIVEKGNKARGVNCASHGSISVIGRRRVMEDTLTVAPSDFPSTLDFFGVYDGHGGARVSSACRDNLHSLIGEEVEGWRGQRVDWEILMSDCFKKMDDEVVGEDAELGRLAAAFGSKLRSVGSTALVMVLGAEEIVVANCGHSRAVLFRNGKVVPLSCDQKVVNLKRV